MSEQFWTGLPGDYDRELIKDRLGAQLGSIHPVSSWRRGQLVPVSSKTTKPGTADFAGRAGHQVSRLSTVDKQHEVTRTRELLACMDTGHADDGADADEDNDGDQD